MPVTIGHAVNAAQHVWGYLREQATEQDRKTFGQYLKRFCDGRLSGDALKRFLLRVSDAQNQPYLTQSLYLTRTGRPVQVGPAQSAMFAVNV